jgi:hypothetical protein
VIVYHVFYERLNETSYQIRAFYPVYSLVRVGRSANLSPAADESLYSSDFNRRVFSRIFNADLLSISHFSFHRWRRHQSKSTLKKLSAFNVSLVRGCYFEQTKRFCREQFFGISLHLYFLTLAMWSIAPITDICVVKSQSKETFILQSIFQNPCIY